MRNPVARMNKLKEMKALIEQGIDNVMSSERYMKFLSFAKQFRKYSFNNTLLIFLQKPDATFVNSYKRWEKMGRKVRKGEKGIKIFAPIIKTFTKEDNSEEEYSRLAGFKYVYVFDISQTDGEPVEVEEFAKNLVGDVEMFEAVFDNLEKFTDYTVAFENTAPANGWCDSSKRKIAIHKGNSQKQKLKTLFHEITHSVLHADKIDSTAKKELEAETCAYLILNSFGIDTGDYSFDYLASWATGQNVEDLMKDFSKVFKLAGELEDKIREITGIGEDEELIESDIADTISQTSQGLLVEA